MADIPAAPSPRNLPKRKDGLSCGFHFSCGLGVTLLTAGMFVALLLASDLSHFTWWYLTVFTCHLVNLVAYTVYKQRYLAERFLWLVLGMTVVVLAGILVMSFAGCSVVRDTSASIGPTGYAFGNFAVHYLPSILTVLGTFVVVSTADFDLIFPEVKTIRWQARVHRELWAGLILFVAYGSQVDVNAAYGCSLSNSTIIVLVSLVVLCMHLLLDKYFQKECRLPLLEQRNDTGSSGTRVPPALE